MFAGVFLQTQKRNLPCIHHWWLLPTSDSQSPRQLGIPLGREASVAKVPSNSNLDANCNLIVCQLARMEPHISTGCGILCCSKYGQFPSHFRQEVAKKGLNCAFSGPCFLLNLLFLSIFPTHKGSDPSLFWRLRSRSPGHCGAGKVFLGA